MSLTPAHERPDVLRRVSDEKAFCFYTAIGAPTGDRASSFREFLDMVKKADVRSLDFHIQRGDFERWFDALGDRSSVAKLAKMREEGLSGETLRERILQSLGARFRKAEKAARGR